MELKQAVILAGGRGERLMPFTANNPKPMIPINGKPFLEHLIELLKKNKIKEVVILTGYLGEKIEKYFGNGSKFGIKIKYSYLPLKNEKGEENESGLRIKNAEKLLDNKFLLIYCDNYWPLQLEKIKKFYSGKKADVSVVAYSNKDNSTKNNILTDGEGYVTKYDRSRKDKNLNGVEIGFFIINKKILKLFPKQNFHFERDILPQLISKKQVSGYLTDNKYYSIGDAERVKATEKFLTPKKIIFLDRDGTINKKAPQGDYIKKWSEFEFLPGVVEAIKNLCDKGYDIYLITNQSGIARGMMTKKDLDLIHQKMQAELAKNGGKIKAIYACLHGWDDGCDCRKPKPGLLFQAARENYLDLTKTIFIGDDERDMQAGQAAGCKTILIDNKKNLLAVSKKIYRYAKI
ncbi:MAG: HAD-IIIA family hydrolase [Candidatus Staskawiczbacteria bacterium]|jgi:D-glycero-D-manno-heptose 1,7-bisphosphate phosphatase